MSKIIVVDGLGRNLQDVRSSGQFYVTHELDREMDRIGNGVNHMKLDSDFIDSSTEWGKRFDGNALNREKAGNYSLERVCSKFYIKHAG